MKHLALLALSIGLWLWPHSLLAGDIRVPPDQRILLLATERSSTMQKELEQAVELGFRVVAGASAGYDEIAYLLERRRESPARGPYWLLATRRMSTMEDELNQAAAQGYRLHPESILYNDCELVLLMEPLAAEDARYQYRVLETRRTSTLQDEIGAALGRGFRVVDLVSANKNIAVLERPLQP